MINSSVTFSKDLKVCYKSLKPGKHGFNVLITLHLKQLIVLNTKICFALFHLLVPFIRGTQLFKDSLGNRLAMILCILSDIEPQLGAMTS